MMVYGASQDTCKFDQFDFQNDTLALVAARVWDFLFKSKTLFISFKIKSNTYFTIHALDIKKFLIIEYAQNLH